MSSYVFIVLKRSLLLASVSICAIVYAAETVELSVKFVAIEAQLAFVNELQREKIPYRTDQSGTVWYRIDDQKKVAAIQARVIDEVLVGSNAISYQNNDDAEEFILKLKQQNIPYSLKEENKRKFITWRAEDNEKVKEIEQSLLRQRKLKGSTR